MVISGTNVFVGKLQTIVEKKNKIFTKLLHEHIHTLLVFFFLMPSENNRAAEYLVC